MSGAYPEYLLELFASFGPVSVRRMFSGAGVFAEGLMIALVVDGVIFLKADEETIPRFEGEGLSPFSYQRKGGRRTILSYWRMPERLYDDPDEFAVWAQRSMLAAQRSGAKAMRPKSTPKKKAAARRVVKKAAMTSARKRR